MISHSDSIGSLMAAILAVQQDVDHVEKGARNPHFGNTYADLNTFLHALRGPLAEHGIVMTQAPGMDGETVTVETMLVHESGEWIRNRAAAPMQKHDPQGVGSAITYLRRYSLAALFAVPQEDDDGNAASRQRGNGRSRRSAPKGGGSDYTCPECGAENMWDNRADKEAGKRSEKFPDFKCRECDHPIWGAHPDDEGGEAPEELINRTRGLMDTAAMQDKLSPDQATRVEEAIASGDTDRIERALDWLRGIVKEQTEGAPA